jgi:hypothetical protein
VELWLMSRSFGRLVWMVAIKRKEKNNKSCKKEQVK